MLKILADGYEYNVLQGVENSYTLLDLGYYPSIGDAVILQNGSCKTFCRISNFDGTSVVLETLETREVVRVPFYEGVNFVSHFLGGKGVTRDISTKGLSFTTESPIREGLKLSLNFFFRVPVSVEINVKSVVTRATYNKVSGLYEVGVVFIDMDLPFIVAVRDFILMSLSSIKDIDWLMS